MKTRWKALAGLIATCVALTPAAGAQAASQAEIDLAVNAGGQWLAGKQADSGAIGGFNGDWAVGTVAAAGLHAAELRTAPDNPSLQDYWQGQYSASSWGSLPSANGSGQLGKAVLIAHSAGIQPTRVAADVNFAASLASIHDWETGLFGTNASPNAVGFALLALPHLGFPDSVAAPIVQSLLGSQHDDGGWTFSAGGGSAPGDTDLTGAVLAMICSNGMGPGDEAVDRGLDFLKSNQDEATGAIFASGPWVPEFNGPTLGWALIGINACGQDPQGSDWTTGEGVNVIDAALSLQLGSGEFQYTPTSGAEHPNNVSATEAVVRALAGDLFSADPPAPVDPSVSRWRRAPEVPTGTTVPVAIAIEDGANPTRLCSVELPDGVSIRATLDIARLKSVPTGCIE